MVSQKLEKANRQQEKGNKEIPMEQRPIFHFSAPIGWLNDPNGFSYYKEEYHLFYQYHPYDTNWGPMHWGHSKTKDFIKWEQLPVALAPDLEYDKEGCFSGSALEYDGKHVLMYTGVTTKETENGKSAALQTQCIAVGDGISYHKIEKNPVIAGELLPTGCSREDFRDPKIWQEKDAFYAVVGNRDQNGSGQILLFTSKDLNCWNYCGILLKNNYEYGSMWECPDFFELDGNHVLLVSPQDMEAKDLEFHCGNGTLSVIGKFDKTNLIFHRENQRAIDYGLDFYAPQTVRTKDDRRIMIAWMQSWDYHMGNEEFKWSGMMTVPRELRVENGTLFQVPVREIETYYGDTVTYEHVTIDGMLELEGIHGRTLDMTIEVNAGEYKTFEIILAANEQHYTTLSYERDQSVVTFNRTYSGDKRDRTHIRSMRVKEAQGKIKLRVLLDWYSVEVFLNDGEKAMTSLIYTEREAQKIQFCTEGKAEFCITKHEINRE
ncbi:MAG: glycoside hydrolase family 32 protein [Lachnospiraceae bacterium]